MSNNDSFPILRSNSTIPGIARSTRSPSDGASSPMTPRGLTRTTSMQQDDYQRLIQAQQQQQQQQQQQANRGLTVQSPTFNPQLQQASSNWQQQQQPQQQQSNPHQQMMQMNHGQNSYGMSPSGNAAHPSGLAFTGVPSPTNSQSWSQVPNYPFSPSPSSGSGHLLHQPDRVATPRHLSATPAPQQQQQQQQPQPQQQLQMQLQNSSPTLDQSLTGDFDIFNWTQ
jgi:hypothetical protein